MSPSKHTARRYDRGDVDKMFDAQQVLSKIAIEQERYRLAKAQQEKLAVQRAPEQQTQQTQQAPQPRAASPKPDPKAEAWASKHEWFGQDDVMTYAAFGIHRRLVEEEGFDPNSDEYYNEIDRRMVSEFPHKFAGQKNGRSSQVASADTSASRKKTTGRRTVKLSPSQVAMARKLNVPLEEYAKYVKD
jgi:GH15 family glucan-1,4-alpha-glucosidase